MATYKPIQSIALTSSTSSITFTGISQDYQDLVIVCSVKATTGSDAALSAQVNGDTGTNYSHTYVQGVAAGVQTNRATNTTTINAQGGNLAISESVSTFSPYVVNFMNYSNTTTFKTILARGAGTIQSGLACTSWRNTNAIDSIRFFVSTGNFDVGSTFDIYGIQAGTPKAMGGSVTSDGTYWYHTFRNSGTFTIQQGSALTVDYLVVAGGGGGGDLGYTGVAMGGGGAGGFRTSIGGTALSLTPQMYVVTVGAGGAVNTKGADSIFSSITSTGGGKGGVEDVIGGSGGSGGGGGGYNTAGASNTGGAGNTPSTSPSQGNNGGNGMGAVALGSRQGGGGGGAGAVGVAAGASDAGDGGNGIASSITGSSVTYAGGGGGGLSISSGGTIGAGGSGGGGAGAKQAAAIAGTANTGGGGGGAGGVSGGSYTYTAGKGGSGIVVVRYLR